MGRLRGLSFLSNQLGQVLKKDNPDSKTTSKGTESPAKSINFLSSRDNSATSLQNVSSPAPPRPSPASAARKLERQSGISSRPISALYQNQQVPAMDFATDPTPELEPIFNYLNIQTNKLYYEGYLLKLNDLDINGRPYSDRKWIECFAQLIGTVLWMWDADSLEQGGPEAESKPTHMNVADATIKMVESLPTRFENSQPLQNVLSISTAGKNRFLFHFNSLNSLTQWTAAIRLTIYENTLLQESYTGALIAGKGRSLNSIRSILERTRFKYEDWVRVRFSPGTPWQRCWCVISQPDEKLIQKMEKAEKKAKSAYGRPKPVYKGDIKFYPTKKTKKVKPLVTITDAYSAYAIYPQSRHLIDQSSLVKLEGNIKIHSRVETSTEGFVFVLPEVHPAVSGVEIMLRWLFPVYDTFALYGRPTRLLADTVSTRSLMFAMPTGKRATYLDNLDVANLIHTEGSQEWSEQEWRKRLKEATAKRMVAKRDPSRQSSHSGNGGQRSSFPQVRFGDNPHANRSTDAVFALSQRHSASSAAVGHTHSENSSGYFGNGPGRRTPPSRASLEKLVLEEVEEPLPSPLAAQSPQSGETSEESPPVPPVHASPESISPPVPDKLPQGTVSENIDVDQLKPNPPPNPVAVPPAFSHHPRDLPQSRPWPPPELKRANSRVSYGTLSQMAEMSRSREAVPTTNSFGNGSKQNTPSPGSEQVPPATEYNTPGSFSSGQDARSGATLAPTSLEQPFSPVSPISPLPDEVEFHARGHPVDNHNERINVSPQRQPVSRKPVPQRTQDAETRSNYTASSLGSLRHTVDTEALDRVMPRERSVSPQKQPIRRSTDQSSFYDQSSVASPDYASSHKSTVSRRSTASSVAKPRMGVLKVVGAPEPADNAVVIGDTTYRPAPPAAAQPDSNIPLVDFGPTPAYNPAARRPNTADTLKLLGHSRKVSDATIVSNNNHERKPRSSGRITPGANRRSGNWGSEEQRRSLLWQPGLVADGGSPGPRISPEQFVQQRAEADRTASPVYGHTRNISQASSMARPRSGDWTAVARPQTARDQPTRPHSRGSTAALNQVDLSGRLSAREQEHVARVTGSSFLNLSNQSNQQVINSGLVGAIDARERERKALKGGVPGHLVQQAIAQRQNHSPPTGFPAHGYRQPPPPGTPGTPGSEATSYFYTPQQTPQQMPHQMHQQIPPWGQPGLPPGQPAMYSQPPPPPVHQNQYYYR